MAQEYPGGDHALLMGEVIDVEYSDERREQEPLLYYRSSFLINRQESVASQQPLAPQEPLLNGEKPAPS